MEELLKNARDDLANLYTDLAKRPEVIEWEDASKKIDVIYQKLYDKLDNDPAIKQDKTGYYHNLKEDLFVEEAISGELGYDLTADVRVEDNITAQQSCKNQLERFSDKYEALREHESKKTVLDNLTIYEKNTAVEASQKSAEDNFTNMYRLIKDAGKDGNFSDDEQKLIYEQSKLMQGVGVSFKHENNTTEIDIEETGGQNRWAHFKVADPTADPGVHK